MSAATQPWLHRKVCREGRKEAIKMTEACLSSMAGAPSSAQTGWRKRKEPGLSSSMGRNNGSILRPEGGAHFPEPNTFYSPTTWGRFFIEPISQMEKPSQALSWSDFFCLDSLNPHPLLDLCSSSLVLIPGLSQLAEQ